MAEENNDSRNFEVLSQTQNNKNKNNIISSNHSLPFEFSERETDLELNSTEAEPALVQPAILYCKNIHQLKNYWEKSKRVNDSSLSSSNWLSELGIEILLPRSGIEEPKEKVNFFLSSKEILVCFFILKFLLN